MGSSSSFAIKSQRVGLRALSRLGGLPILANPEVRGRVERLLTRAAHEGFRAQVLAGRAFAPKKGSGDATRAATAKPKGIFDLTPTEDQAMLQAAAAELADDVFRPTGAQADIERAIPDKVASAAREMGLTLIGVPAELDGIAEERSAVAGALVMEQLSRGDMGLAVAVMSTAAVATAIASYGSATQQATYLPHFTGESPLAAAALAIQEPQPLFDAMRPQLTGRTQGDQIILTGTKAMVANAETAELFVISAMVDGMPRLVIVEPGAEGLTREDDPGMGVRAARTGRLFFEDVAVPRENLLGTTEDHADCVRRGRLAWAAAAVGTAQAVLDQLIPYTKERKAFGEPIAYRQAVAFLVADIAIELEGMRLLVLKAAARLDKGQDATDVIAKVRSLVATYGSQIGSNAVQLLGGHGFVKEWDNERWFRDLRGAGLLEGTLLV